MRIERPRSTALLLANLTISSLLATAALIPGPAWSPPIRYTLAFFITTFLLLLALSTIEYAGIRFLGKQHAYRVTPTVALTTCAHASFAWLLSGAAVAITAQTLQRIGADARSPVLIGVILAAFLTGMIAYSILCGLGYRALRYANS